MKMGLLLLWTVIHLIMICSKFVCCRMASRFCDTDSCRTSKVVYAVPRPYYESSPANFASLYTAKNGTPLNGMSSFRNSRDSNELAVCTPSPLVHASTVWPCDLSFSDATCSSDDPSQTFFCNRYNVQSCLLYLNQVMFYFYFFFIFLIIRVWTIHKKLIRPIQ